MSNYGTNGETITRLESNILNETVQLLSKLNSEGGCYFLFTRAPALKLRRWRKGGMQWRHNIHYS